MPYERIDNPDNWSPDADLRMADWLRQTWTLPTNITDFLPVLQRRNDAVTFAQYQDSLNKFMMLPIAAQMPDLLRKSLEDAGFKFQD